MDELVAPLLEVEASEVPEESILEGKSGCVDEEKAALLCWPHATKSMTASIQVRLFTFFILFFV